MVKIEKDQSIASQNTQQLVNPSWRNLIPGFRSFDAPDSCRLFPSAYPPHSLNTPHSQSNIMQIHAHSSLSFPLLWNLVYTQNTSAPRSSSCHTVYYPVCKRRPSGWSTWWPSVFVCIVDKSWVWLRTSNAMGPGNIQLNYFRWQRDTWGPGKSRTPEQQVDGYVFRCGQ